jgi:hypothetical protein
MNALQAIFPAEAMDTLKVPRLRISTQGTHIVMKADPVGNTNMVHIVDAAVLGYHNDYPVPLAINIYNDKSRLVVPATHVVMGVKCAFVIPASQNTHRFEQPYPIMAHQSIDMQKAQRWGFTQPENLMERVSVSAVKRGVSTSAHAKEEWLTFPHDCPMGWLLRSYAQGWQDIDIGSKEFSEVTASGEDTEMRYALPVSIFNKLFAEFAGFRQQVPLLSLAGLKIVATPILPVKAVAERGSGIVLKQTAKDAFIEMQHLLGNSAVDVAAEAVTERDWSISLKLGIFYMEAP